MNDIKKIDDLGTQDGGNYTGGVEGNGPELPLIQAPAQVPGVQIGGLDSTHDALLAGAEVASGTRVAPEATAALEAIPSTPALTDRENEEVPAEKEVREVLMTPDRAFFRLATHPDGKSVASGMICIGAGQRKALGIKGEEGFLWAYDETTGAFVGTYKIQKGARSLLNHNHVAFDIDVCVLGGDDVSSKQRVILRKAPDGSPPPPELQQVAPLNEQEDRTVPAVRKPREPKEHPDRLVVRVVGPCNSQGKFAGICLGMRDALGVEKNDFVDVFDLAGNYLETLKVRWSDGLFGSW